MNSKIVGQYYFDPDLLTVELNTLLSLPYVAGYSDFIFGRWETCVLYNGSGNHTDDVLSEYIGAAKPTVLMRDLSYVPLILAQLVDMRYLKWLRVFVFHSGVILPHRDYLELNKGYTRLHIPLQTDLGALHSEDQHVFHMRLGDVWHLDARSVHSACNISKAPRVSLCLDFDPEIPLSQLLKIPQDLDGTRYQAHVVARKAFSERDKELLLARHADTTPETFRQLLADLAMIHFQNDVSADAMFTWLGQMATEWKSEKLTAMVKDVERFAVLMRPSVAVKY